MAGVATSSPELGGRVRLSRADGATGKYSHSFVGKNSRLDAIQAALLSVRLRRIDALLDRRDRIAAAYDSSLRELPAIKLPHRPDAARRTFHQYVKIDGRRRNHYGKSSDHEV